MRLKLSEKIFSIKVWRSLLVALLILPMVFLGACKLPAEIRKEEAALKAMQHQEIQEEMERRAFCETVKTKFKVGMTDVDVEALGVQLYPYPYRRSIECDPWHPNHLTINLKYIKIKFGAECRVEYWELLPISKCMTR